LGDWEEREIKVGRIERRGFRRENLGMGRKGFGMEEWRKKGEF
jgi:hypothetical protein